MGSEDPLEGQCSIPVPRWGCGCTDTGSVFPPCMFVLCVPECVHARMCECVCVCVCLCMCVRVCVEDHLCIHFPCVSMNVCMHGLLK